MTENVPEGLRYTKTHEWVRTEAGEWVIGITDHAQAELTDIVFVDLPGAGKKVAAGQPILILESVKTVADIYAPADGEVTASNSALREHPELVNREPYTGGWLVRFRPVPPAKADHLLTAQAYQSHVASGSP
ncbi:MAG: glycine cleavage system protein GcvH [Thermoplasmata archaeon]|nr:glycine cleavage system protein GcvH [Thermoplasmata archaeon]